MSNLLNQLKGGTLISDGNADQVAEKVLMDPALFNQLLAGLKVEDDIIRARSAHALEKVSRIHPDWFSPHFHFLTVLVQADPLPMVRWHLVMLLTNLASISVNNDLIIEILSDRLNDESAFVKSWAISGLCILGRRNPEWTAEIIQSLRPMRNVQGTAVRSRASKAVELLENSYLPIPKGWVKAK
jgi:HEAT repeat protein